MEPYEELVFLIDLKQLILVGENHGVVENASFVRNLVNQYILISKKVKFVGFEYPSFVHPEFMDNVKNDNYENIASSEWGKILLKDGRFSKDHFNLLRYFQSEGIETVFFDSGKGSWDERDRMMVENLASHIDSLNTNEKAIIVVGNIHTNIQNMTVNDKPYKPMGTYLNKEKIMLIKLEYHNGEFFNFGRRSFSEVPVPKKTIEKIDEETIYFHIAQATPTQ